MASRVDSNGSDEGRHSEDEAVQQPSADSQAVQSDTGNGRQDASARKLGRNKRGNQASKPDAPSVDRELYGLIDKAVSGIREPWALPKDPGRERWPKLLKLLTERQFPSGELRDCPKLSVVATPTGWIAKVVDTEMSVCFEVEFEHLEDVLESLHQCTQGRRGRVYTVKYGKGWERIKAESRKDLGKERKVL